MRLLVDECLSPALANGALARGHVASHVTWLGKAGWDDWRLLSVIVDGDWIFITRNAADFRGPAARPGPPGLHATLHVHPGLVCLVDAGGGMNLSMMLELFDVAVQELERDADLVNQVLEIVAEEETFLIRRYGLP